MKNTILLFLKLTLLPPILGGLIVLAIYWIVEGHQYPSSMGFFAALVAMLWVYSLPYCLVYAFMMIKSQAKRNKNGFIKSISYATTLGFLSIFLSEAIFGDGNPEIGAVLMATVAGAIFGGLATLLLPKTD